MKTLAGGACAVAMLAALAAGASAQTLQIAVDQSPVGLDPHLATAFSTQLVNSAIYEGLTAIDADLRVVPALAASWTVSPDGLTYVFRLRPNARFHDGKPVTPADVAASVARVRDPKTGSPFASRFAMVKSVDTDGADGVRIEPRHALGAAAGPVGGARHRAGRRDRSGAPSRRDRALRVPRMGGQHADRARPQRGLLGCRSAEAHRTALQHRARGGDAPAWA